jgi:type IV secretory pathway VirD2 relaxase
MVRERADYITRDGQDLFGRDGIADKEQVARDWGDDRKLFQVVVSPNDGHALDMREYTRAVVARWEERTGPLEWVAAVHSKPDMAHAQGNRHVHILIRAVQDDRDIRFSQALIQHGFREMAREVATERLGPMDEREQRALERQKQEMAERRIETGAMGSKRDLAERRRDRGVERELERGLR